MDMDNYDVVVVGGGMAGVSIACELSADRRVVVLDMEGTLAFHTTGRSAAMFLESYGGAPIRALTTASRAFLESPPETMDSSPLAPLPVLHVGRRGRTEAVERLFREASKHVDKLELLDEHEIAGLQPMLRPQYAERAVFEPGAEQIDVHALHQGFLRGLRRNSSEVVVSARVVSADRSSGSWTVTDHVGRQFSAPVVVNAAGAWVDQLAGVFGADPINIRALRRSAFMVAAPADSIARGEPMMIADVDEAFYIKPDSGQYLCSPADETPQDPGDAKPDEVEIARAIDAINEATTLNVRSVRSSWAGLRNFVADRTPVVGFDPDVDGLFWLAAQGGYGIQTAPALARTAAALVRTEPLPADVVARGLTEATLSPARSALRG
jgi:D-arginine dehydrogenase